MCCRMHAQSSKVRQVQKIQYVLKVRLVQKMLYLRMCAHSMKASVCSKEEVS
jgi:hypothetical protein